MSNATGAVLPSSVRGTITTEVTALPFTQLQTSQGVPVVCLSHLRWDFVLQRPQHLLSRAAKQAPVLFFEEPLFEDVAEPQYEICPREEGRVMVIRAILPHGYNDVNAIQKQTLDEVLAAYNLDTYALWYYTPMALEFSRHLTPAVTVFDVMDELSAFKFAPPHLLALEQELLDRADVVFTGGLALYEAKAHRHSNIHCFPSSIDKAHFGKARQAQPEPDDQANIPHPRAGFFGVIDERFDTELLMKVAEMRPNVHFVMLGPIVKIDPASLPQRENIHLLGGKKYDDLPAYLAGWDVALLPFALNESTKFISPTKTPEYLAGGKPTVSTPILDVIRPYGEKNLVHIAEGAEAFAQAIDKALDQIGDRAWMEKVDDYLLTTSWNLTWQKMLSLIESELPDTAKDEDSKSRMSQTLVA